MSIRAHAVDSPHHRVWLEIAEGPSRRNPRRRHAPQIFPRVVGDSLAHDRQVGGGVWRETRSAWRAPLKWREAAGSLTRRRGGGCPPRQKTLRPLPFDPLQIRDAKGWGARRQGG